MNRKQVTVMSKTFSGAALHRPRLSGKAHAVAPTGFTKRCLNLASVKSVKRTASYANVRCVAASRVSEEPRAG
jgi:hypothetical protein